MSAAASFRVGSVGLGIMGKPISENVLKKGVAAAGGSGIISSFSTWNRTASKAESLVPLGAILCKSPREVAAASDIVLTNVTDSNDVRDIILRPDDGILSGAKPGTIIVDHSTILPDVAREICQRCAEKNVWFLDAPVSGGEPGARNGVLSIMCGGSEEALEKVRPVLALYSKSITLVGGSGAGQVAKACNQVVVAAQMSAMAEALVLAQKMGVDPQKVVAAISGGAAACWALTNKPARIFAGDRSAQFKIKDQVKDLKIVMAAANANDICLPVTSQNLALFQECMAHGEGLLDNSAVLNTLERMNATRVGPAPAAAAAAAAEPKK